MARAAAATGAAAPTVAVATDLGLTMVVQTKAEGSPVAIEVLTDEGWEQHASGIPVERFDSVSVAAAGEWLAILASGQPPVVVHVPTGVWHVASDSPLIGMEAPNSVWTGEQLVVWGGVPDDGSIHVGADWTPPTA